MNFTSRLILCTLLGAACNLSASAATSTSSQQSTTGWQLIDLDPDDGVTPWIQFKNPELFY